MGSGLIYAIVIVLWIAYFVPAWLRRHDQVSESKSVARYRSAMRVVSRGTATEIEITASERSEVRAEIIHRRKKSYVVILGSFLLTLTTGVLGLTSLLLPIFPMLAGGYFFWSVRQADAHDERMRRSSEQPGIQEGHKATPTRWSLLSSQRHQVAPLRLEAPALPDSESVNVLIRPVENSGSNDAWSPIPVPTPAYVTAPKAVRPYRSLDVTKNGSWSAQEQAAEAERLAAIAPGRDQVFDQEAVEAAIEAAIEAEVEASKRAANG